MEFRDRQEAGRLLAQRLQDLAAQNPVVLALPRGGLPVAAEVAEALRCTLEVFLVRKLGAPWQPEYGFGAIAEGGFLYLRPDAVRELGLDEWTIERIAARETEEIERRRRLYRGDHALPDLRGRTVIVVDDGIATGGTVRAAIEALRALGVGRLVVAVPVAAPDIADVLRRETDQFVCLHEPFSLVAVGMWYRDFHQVADEEVAEILSQARARMAGGRKRPATSPALEPVRIQAADVVLHGDLTLVPDGAGLVLFAHGSGSSRLSPRNRMVASTFNRRGLSTLLFDLLSEHEERIDERTREYRFDIPLLARRLALATDWAGEQANLRELPVGYFGSSTGAAAALVAAAARAERVRAVVSRGGRPDLAGPSLSHVRAPVLLIVGSLDEEVLELNRQVLPDMGAPAELAIVPGATHLFAEPGKLEEAARLACDWFVRHLAAAQPQPATL